MSREVDRYSGSLRKSANVIMAEPHGEIGLVGQKLFNFLLSQAYAELQTKSVHRVPVRDVLQYLGHSSTDRMIEALDGLRSLDVTVEYIDDDGKVHRAGAGFLSYDATKSTDGVLEFAFDRIMLRFIHDPKIYATLSPSTVRRFRSKYAEQLYEVMAIYRRRRDKVWRVDVEDFRRAMHVPDGTMTRFDNLRKQVVEKAVRELNNVAEFTVSVEYLRGGRGGKVTRLAFTVAERDAAAAPEKELTTPKRKGRDPDTPDMYDGRTDAERGGPAQVYLSPDAIERAGEMIGDSDKVQFYEDEWRREVSGRKVKDPDGTFLIWLKARLEQEGGNDAFRDLSEDSLGGLLDKWANGGNF